MLGLAKQAPSPAVAASKRAAAPPPRATHAATGNQAALRRLSATRPHLQAKLEIGAADDPLEREADRVADEVMRMPDPLACPSSAPIRVSRKFAACKEEENASTLQTKPASTAVAMVGQAPPIVHEVLRSPGQPLDTVTLAFFEPRFGRDFADVRVHNDARAASSAQVIHANAYTVRNHLVFGAGKYLPNSSDGNRLLAHELTHVVQQNAALHKSQFASEIVPSHGRARPAAVACDHPPSCSVGSCLIQSQLESSLPAIQGSLLRVPHTTLTSSAILFRSESVHPEEQHCEDVSDDPTAPCAAIIECITDLIEALAGRFSVFSGDPGHLKRIRIVQGILKALITKALQECQQGEFDPELQEEARKWANKDPMPQQGPATEEQKQTLSEKLPSVPTWVWWAIGAAAAALIIGCFATGICEAAAIAAALGAVGDFVAGIIIAALRLAGVGLLAATADGSSPDGIGGDSEAA